MLGLFRKKVLVRFVDADSGELIARSRVPIEQLPERFDTDSELEMAGVKYAVASAAPRDKAQFSQSKGLTLRVRAHVMVDVGQLLYSLPSICGSALPPDEETAHAEPSLRLHEDDWRQCEFVDVAERPNVEAELADILDVHRHAAAEFGWRRIHVRERIPRPLPPGISWEAVSRLLGHPTEISGVALGSPRSLLGARAAALDGGVIVWGVEESGELICLCAEEVDGASAVSVEAIQAVAREFSLLVVHWCRCQVDAPDGVATRGAVGQPWAPRP